MVRNGRIAYASRDRIRPEIPTRRRGVLLLEIIVSIAILVLGFAAIGGQIHQAFQASQRADRLARGVMLTESIFTELDSGLLFPEREQEGDFRLFGFGAQYEGWAWRLLIDESPFLGREDRDQGMFLVTAEVYYGHPDLTGDNVSDKQLVYAAHALRSEPGRVDLVEDLGLDQQDLEALTAFLPESTGIDLTQPLDPSTLAQLPFEGLLEDILPNLPPEIMAMLGASGGSLTDLADRLGVGVNPTRGGAAGGRSGTPGVDDLSPEQQDELEELLRQGGDPLELLERLREMQSQQSQSGGSSSGGSRRR